MLQTLQEGCGLCAIEYKSKSKVVLFQLLFGEGETVAVTMDTAAGYCGTGPFDS